MTAPPPPTIDTFLPGTAHTTGRVAKLFGVSAKTVRSWIHKGALKASVPTGSTILLIPGEEVQRAWRAMGFDPSATTPLPVTPAEERRRAEAALKKLSKRR